MPEEQTPSDGTRTYYSRHASEYVKTTAHRDLSHLWDLLGEYLEPGSRVLDLGCGSGRDLKALAERGYKMVGLDYSHALAQHASKYSGQKVVVEDFRSLPSNLGVFDGIWAVASLLHIPRAQIFQVLGGLKRLLRPSGILLSSMQSGQGYENSHDGRHYERYEPDEWSRLLQESGFIAEEVQESSEQRQTGDLICEVKWIVTLAVRAS